MGVEILGSLVKLLSDQGLLLAQLPVFSRKLRSLKHHQQKPLDGDAPLMWKELKHVSDFSLRGALHRMRSEELSCDHPSASGPLTGFGMVETFAAEREGKEARNINHPKNGPTMSESPTKP